jgi:ParB/RepB/Spo0J family partition protein
VSKEIRFLSVDQIAPSDLNPNRMTIEEFQGLVDSVKNAGFLWSNPIIVRPNGNGTYEIVDGEHRWRAAKKLGIGKVPCDIVEMDDLEADRHRVILNKDRGSLDYFKLSKLLNRNYERYNHNGMTQKKLGELFGFSRPTVANLLPIFPRLKKCSHGNTFGFFSNHDLRELARVESDLLREWLVEVAKDKDSKWIEKKATLCNDLFKHVTSKVSENRIQLFLERLKPQLFEWHIATLKDEVDRLAEEYSRSWRVICGDACQEMRRLVEEKQFVDLVITDPPYNISAPNKVIKRQGEIVEADIAEWDHQTREEYEAFVRNLLSSIRDVLKPTASFYVFLDKPFSGKAWFMAEEMGLKPKNIVHWVKTNPTPHPRKNNYLSAVEHILFGTKSDNYTFNFTIDNEMHNVIRCPVAGGEERQKYPAPTAKPVPLIERLIRVSSRVNDTVLDCFAGRGTTGIAAIIQKRNCILIDSDPACTKTAERWITDFLREEA